MHQPTRECLRALTHSKSIFFFFNDTATTEIYTLSLHDALPIFQRQSCTDPDGRGSGRRRGGLSNRSEEHTSELQSHVNLVCRLLLEKKKNIKVIRPNHIKSSKNCMNDDIQVASRQYILLFPRQI